ncbi:MAG: transcriptional repressor [Candidatus Omnitrophica bacterium]|nr:transcriptional repressor [Candidatus Omnitrophota bacterium]MBD3268808.1 transcriptional repressor [Candidatus Omnitrophota bacterium]
MYSFYINKMKKEGLKVTPRRRAIIEFFLKKDSYLDTETVWKSLKPVFSRFGLPGVYRNLEQMRKAGLLTRIQVAGRRRYYGLCSNHKGEHHHHIICVKCGKVGEYSCSDFFKKKQINGFKVTGHFLQLNGLCPSCKEDKS